MLYTRSAFRKMLKASNPSGVTVQMDVDFDPMTAVVIADAVVGINVEIYFRLHSPTYTFESIKPIMRLLHSLGMNVGYHHETMDMALGDPELAKSIFINDIEAMRRVIPVSKAYAHGNCTEHDNNNIWNFLDWREVGVQDPTFDEPRWADIHRSNSLSKFLLAHDGENIRIHIHPEYWVPKLSRFYLMGIRNRMFGGR